MKPIIHPALPCLALLLAACGGDAGAGSAAVTRDSAGIQIVENDAPAWKRGAEWRVGAEPIVDIGGEDGDPNAQFGDVYDAVRLADGSLLVADGQAQEIRAFDARGGYLRTIGRKGGGPGEFQGLHNVFALPGDTVAAFDYGAARLSFFAPDGALVRDLKLAPIDGTLPPRPLALLSDGSMAVIPLYNPNFRNSPRPSRDTVTLARYSPAGAQVGSVRRMAGDETVTIVSGEGKSQMAMRAPVPFGGRTVVATSGTRLLVGDNARYELAEHGADGRLTRLIRRRAEPQAVTEADRGAHAERMRANAGRPLTPGDEKMLAATPFPERKGWFAAMQMDPDGNAWVQRFPEPDADTPWDVFDPAGRFLGTVTTPAGLNVHQVGADFVMGTARDDLGVEHVRVHRLEKPAAR